MSRDLASAPARDRSRNRRPRPASLARVALTAMALAAALAGGALAQAGLGQPAPDWTLTGNDGAAYTLSDGFGHQVQLLYMMGYA